jgi:Na+/H+ antiporter NhaD/arsenite permease-like protein
MEPRFYIALFVFLGVYVLITSERIHRTKVALLGAVIMVLAGIISQKQAIAHIDFNTIFLLMGMMILVNIIKGTGFFEFIAIKGVKVAKGKPLRILLMFSILTAGISALLDNVTTVLLFGPIVLFVADVLGITAFPFLVALVMSANIGGMATLIGAPPNIMIGSATEFSFLDFIVHMFPITAIVFAANIGFLWLVFRKKMNRHKGAEAVRLDASKALKDRKLLWRSLAVLILTILGFTMHSVLGVQTGVIALAGASLMLVLVPGNPLIFFEKIEWNTLFFFGGLFVLVGSLEEVGVIELIFRWLSGLTTNVGVLSMIFLWVGAVACSFVDNIPFTAMMIPLVTRVSEHLVPEAVGTADVFLKTMPIWWALAIGVNIGGNGTIIAASPNVVISGIAEQSGNKIRFMDYFKYGMASVILSALIGSAYIWIRYL